MNGGDSLQKLVMCRQAVPFCPCTCIGVAGVVVK